MDQFVLDLLAGNDEHAQQFADCFDDLQTAQQPDAVTVCCGDSRVLQDGMWDTPAPGHLFTHSNIGNRVTEVTDDGRVVTGDVLYPLVHTDTQVAIVTGHTGCGAVTAAYRDLTTGIDEPASIQRCLDLLERDIAPGFDLLPDNIDDGTAINSLVEYNVDTQVAALCDSPDVPDGVTVLGVVYDFQDIYGGERGEVHVTTVDGERDPAALRAAYPEIADRIRRLFPYETA
ncbi:MAG: carbonic anhydrase [Halovenus sp.]